MKLHANAKTCPKSRRLLVERVLDQEWSLTEAAMAAGVSDRTGSLGDQLMTDAFNLVTKGRAKVRGNKSR